MWRKIAKFTVLILVGVIALGLLFIDLTTCGPIRSSLLPGHGLTGGPHYFRTFNHGCWPWDPQSLYDDGTTPEKTANQVVAAWFDEKRRLVKTQKFYDFGKLDWWQEMTYDERGRLKSLTRGNGKVARVRSEYENGWFVRDVELGSIKTE